MSSPLLQDSFPMRFKGIHYINEPSIFDMIFAIVKPFMKEKILNRVCIYCIFNSINPLSRFNPFSNDKF